MKVFLYACFLIPILAANAQADAAGTLSGRFIALAIQGDLQPAHALFDDVPADGAQSDVELAERFRQRFVDRTEPSDPATGNPLADRIVTAYRDYWRRALMHEASDEPAEFALVGDLSASLRGAGMLAPEATDDEVYTSVAAALRGQGFQALVVSAAPLQDLFVWRGEEIRTFEVELTGEVREVRVAFLSDFASLGWKHYASLGLATTTGWVEEGVLYCVEWAYAPDTENFRVSYLKHEAQHLADFERFPGLPSADLEYRAKLTELAFAARTLPRLLEDFQAKGAPNPDSPHAAANWRVVRDVRQALFGEPVVGTVNWMTVEVGRVNRVARGLLEKDSARLEAQHGARNTTRLRQWSRMGITPGILAFKSVRT